MPKQVFSVLTLLCCALNVVPSQAASHFVSLGKAGAISLTYPDSYGAKAIVTKVKAAPLENPDDKPDGVAPEHWEVTFPKSAARINIYPVANAAESDFNKKYPTIVDASKSMTQILKARPTILKDVPIMPWQDASTPFFLKKKYLVAPGAKMVRYVAQYGVEPTPITNKDLSYVAQGLSSDGNYYISVFAPVAAKQLPTAVKFDKDYSGYIKGASASLEKTKDADFTPKLADLDKLVSSIAVGSKIK